MNVTFLSSLAGSLLGGEKCTVTEAEVPGEWGAALWNDQDRVREIRLDPALNSGREDLLGEFLRQVAAHALRYVSEPTPAERQRAATLAWVYGGPAEPTEYVAQLTDEQRAHCEAWAAKMRGLVLREGEVSPHNVGIDFDELVRAGG